MADFFIGVDIGGTNTELGIFNKEYELLGVRNFRTMKPHWPDKVSLPTAFFDLLEYEIRQLAADYTPGMAEVSAVGVGLPGTVDSKSGMAIGAVNLGWVNVPFVQEMKRRLGVPVFIDNDVRIYTLGEAFAGAGVNHSNIICLTLGTGMAAGIIINGRLVRGSTLFAGEIGHEQVEGEQRLCNCGRIGCLETVASATGIAYLAKQKLLADPTSSLHNIASTRELTSQDVYQACEEGDPAALRVFQEVGSILGRKLVTYLFLLNPDIVIIGGGASRAGNYLLDPIRNVIQELYPPMQGGTPKVVTAQLNSRAGLYGAVYFAREYNNEGV